MITRFKPVIQSWNTGDIYAVSLWVTNYCDKSCEPVVTLGYNTGIQPMVARSSPIRLVESLRGVRNPRNKNYGSGGRSVSGIPLYHEANNEVQYRAPETTARGLKQKTNNIAKRCNEPLIKGRLVGIMSSGCITGN